MPRQKRILVLHARVAFSRGGAELLVEGLTKNLNSRGFQAEILEVPFRWYPTNDLYNSMLMWRMQNFEEINGQEISLVIPTKFPTYGIPHPNKVIWLMHQHRPAYDLFNHKQFGLCASKDGNTIKEKIERFDNQFIPEASDVFSISRTVADRLKKYNGLSAKPLYHPPALAGQYYCGKPEKYILSVGRLDPLKRVDLLIQALKHCSSDVKAIIVGTGHDKERLQRLVTELKLGSRIKFTGFVNDQQLLQLYANSLAVFFAPIDEDYGYVTLEAFLSHKTIITCEDSGGVLEFAKNKINSIICKPEPEEIGAGIEWFIQHEKACADYGQEGYETVKDINWDNVVETLTQSIRGAI